LLIAVLVVLQHTGQKQHFIPVFFYSFTLHGLVLFALICTTRKTPGGADDRGPDVLPGIFRYARLAFIANLLFLLQSRVDYFFVKRYCSAEDLGNYIQVSKIAQAFFILPSMIAAVLFPVIAGGLQPSSGQRVRTISVLILSAYLIILGVLAFSGYWLFPLAYGESFRKMFIPFVLLVPGIIAISSLYPYTAYFSASNQVAVNIRGSLIAAAIILAGDAMLIPKYGIYAAALVSSIGYIAFQFYVLSVFSGQFHISLGKLFTLSRQEFKDAFQRLNPSTHV
jgi:O-antigen/teichoic acid export membrane protein